MNILLVHRYYWPDTPPYAGMLRAIAARLASDGHDVTVLSSQPSYDPDAPPCPARERLDGAEVVRLRLPRDRSAGLLGRTTSAALFAVRIFAHIVRRRYNVVMSGSIPPVATGLAASLGAAVRGARFVYHNQDIHPEGAATAGAIRPWALYRLLRRLDTTSCNRAASIVVLSADMAATMAARGVPADRLAIINNFDLAPPAPELPADLRRPAGDLRVLFAGNLGRFQGLDTVIDAAHELADEPSVRFDMLGTGVEADRLRERAGALVGRTVFFHGQHPAPIASAMAADADVGLVTLRPRVIRVAYPSKTMTYLAAGTPILVVVEADTELARMVVDEGIGWVVEPGDASGVAAAITAARNSDASAMRRRARKVFERRFERSVVLDRWAALLESVAS